MSIIAYKIEKGKVSVACDGRVLAGDEIISEDKVKISKVKDYKIICGATGISDTSDLWKDYVSEHASSIIKIEDVKNVLLLAIDFKNYIIDDYHYGDEMFNIFGGFFFITPHFSCVINYDNDKSPYVTHVNEEYGCFGSTYDYTNALLDVGIDLEDAIKISAKKFTTINDHVTKLSFDLKHEPRD